jgi:hypothetical protein
MIIADRLPQILDSSKPALLWHGVGGVTYKEDVTASSYSIGMNFVPLNALT